jgi:hypothetical protein
VDTQSRQVKTHQLDPFWAACTLDLYNIFFHIQMAIHGQPFALTVLRSLGSDSWSRIREAGPGLCPDRSSRYPDHCRGAPVDIQPISGLAAHVAGLREPLSTPRDQLLFANSPEVMPAYHSLTFDIRESGCMDVGLKIDSSDIEYPFWFLLDAPHSGVRIDHLDVPGGSARYLLQDIRPCAIVCSYACDQSQHELPLATVYQGKYFLYMQPSLAEY